MQAFLKALKNRRKHVNPSSNEDGIFSIEDLRRILVGRENEQREQENLIKIQNKQKLIKKVLVDNQNTFISGLGLPIFWDLIQ
jgi:hypothetical protein